MLAKSKLSTFAQLVTRGDWSISSKTRSAALCGTHIGWVSFEESGEYDKEAKHEKVKRAHDLDSCDFLSIFFSILSQLLFLLQLFVFNFVQLYSNWNDTRKPSSRRRWKEHMTWFSLLDHWEQWLIVCMEDTLHTLQKLTFMSCFRFLVASCFVTAIFIEEINCHKRFQHHDYYSF